MKLTVKEHKVVGEALEKSAIGRLLWYNTGPSRLALIVVEDEQNWQGNYRSDDGERAKSPLPSAVLVELLCRSWASEGGEDIWRGGKSKGESTILDSGGIGDEDLENVGHAVESEPIEALGSRVRAGFSNDNAMGRSLPERHSMLQRSCIQPS